MFMWLGVISRWPLTRCLWVRDQRSMCIWPKVNVHVTWASLRPGLEVSSERGPDVWPVPDLADDRPAASWPARLLGVGGPPGRVPGQGAAQVVYSALHRCDAGRVRGGARVPEQSTNIQSINQLMPVLHRQVLTNQSVNQGLYCKSLWSGDLRPTERNQNN